MFFIANLVLWLFLFLPFIIFVSLPCTIFKLFHILAAAIFASELIPIWKWQDSIFAAHPSSSKAVVSCNVIYKLEGFLNLEEFRAHFLKVFLSTPELAVKNVNFLCYLEKFGLYIFKRRVKLEDLDLNFHIREGPTNLKSEPEVQEFASTYLSTEDGRNNGRPCWEIVVVHLKDKSESFIILKMHHALLDGYTFVKITQKLSGVPQPYAPEVGLGWKKMLRALFEFPTTILTLLSRQWGEGPSPFKNGSPLANENPWFVSWAPLPLSKFKEARKALGSAKFKTVLLAAQVSSLRKYFLEKFGGESGEANLPTHAWIPSPYPVPSHPAMIEDTMCNHFTFNYYRVPFRSLPYSKIISEAESSFSELEGVGVPQIWDYILGPLFLWNCPQPMFVFGMKMSNKYGILTQEQCLSVNMLSSAKLSILGCKISNVYATVVLSSLYASTHFNLISISNGDNVNIAVSGSKKIFRSQKDLDEFVSVSLSKELDEIINQKEKKQ